MTNDCKAVKVTYTVCDIFKIPRGLDLENPEQVKFWGVKYNVLEIQLTNDKTIEIHSEGWSDDFNFKYPDTDGDILDANEVCLDEEDFEFFDCNNF